MTSRDYFKGKRIAVIGLGPHGEMVTDTKYLIKAGALVGVYDLRSEMRIKSHIVALRAIGLANYVCGSIPPDDLLDMDIIILSPEYPRDSSFLKGARENGIQIEYAETLFFKLAPPVTLVGIMGNCGKATIMSVLGPLLEAVSKAHEGQGFYIIDPESAEGALTHLKKIKSADIVLMRITANLMRELFGMRISPHVAVFTSIPSAESYVTMPFELLSFQTYNNFIIASDAVIDATHSVKFPQRAKMIRTKPTIIPVDWDIRAKGPHDRENISLALEVARLFKIDEDQARNIIEKWKPLRNRLELVKKVKSVEYYNDSASVSSHSTMIALKTLSIDKNVLLIFGGVDSGGDYKSLYSVLSEYVHTIVVLPGSGTIRHREQLSKVEGVVTYSATSVEDAVTIASEHSQKGDRVIFSPGFEAGGFDKSRDERGERFVKAVRGL